MKLATIQSKKKIFYGLIKDEGFVALNEIFPKWNSLKDVIINNGFNKIENSSHNLAVTHKNEDFSYMIPILNPEKIICVGINYPDRNAEYNDGQQNPKNMSLFVRFPRSFVGHGEKIVRPKASDQLDYEGEVAIIIGKEGRHILENDAYKYISAITVCNEGTVRDWVRHAKFNVTQGKNFEKSGSMGPYIIPFKNKNQIEDIALETRVNDELRQNDRTSRMIFNIPKQLSYISTFTTLVPGDIIVTGTPTGAGARFDPPKFLKPDDIVKVSVEGIGELINKVEDEK